MRRPLLQRKLQGAGEWMRWQRHKWPSTELFATISLVVRLSCMACSKRQHAVLCGVVCSSVHSHRLLHTSSMAWQTFCIGPSTLAQLLACMTDKQVCFEACTSTQRCINKQHVATSGCDTIPKPQAGASFGTAQDANVEHKVCMTLGWPRSHDIFSFFFPSKVRGQPPPVAPPRSLYPSTASTLRLT